MNIPDVLLDTSWSLQLVPGTRLRSTSLKALVNCTEAHAASSMQLRSLAQECFDSLLSQGPAYRDELNDEREKTGQLRECVISQLWPHPRSLGAATANSRSLGVLIESRYQKTTYQTVLLGNPPKQSDADACPVSLILSKAAASHIRHIVSWLDLKFDLPAPTQLRLPSELILHACSKYLHSLSSQKIAEPHQEDALRQATLSQVIGNLKLTFTITNTTETDVASMLRTMEFDIPSQTVDVLLRKAQQTQSSGSTVSTAFLDELATAVHERTGLRLPLSANPSSHSARVGATSALEPPVKVTRIACAAFAISVDGRLKCARKPIESAEVIGYQETMIRAANWELLEAIRAEAENKGARQEEDG